MITQKYNINNQHILNEGLEEFEAFKHLSSNTQQLILNTAKGQKNFKGNLQVFQKLCQQVSNFNDEKYIVKLWIESQKDETTILLLQVFDNDINGRNLDLLTKWLDEAGFDLNNIFIQFFKKFYRVKNLNSIGNGINKWTYNQLLILNNLVSEGWITQRDIDEEDTNAINIIYCKSLYNQSYNDIKQYLKLYEYFQRRELTSKDIQVMQEDLKYNKVRAPSIDANLNGLKEDNISLDVLFYKNRHAQYGLVPLSDIVYIYNLLQKSKSSSVKRQETKEEQDKLKKLAIDFLKYISKGKIKEEQATQLYNDFKEQVDLEGGR